MEEIKEASNFELNVLNLGVKRIQLVKGDRFTSNGHTFDYQPSTAENKGKGKRYRYTGRVDNMQAMKYKKDVLRADNIKLVIDRPLDPEEPADRPYNVLNRWRVWEVQYAYEQPKPEFDNLLVMVIEYDNYKVERNEWSFVVHELEVERETKELYFLKANHPIHHRSKIEKKELNEFDTARGGLVHCTICEVKDYDKMEIELFKYAHDKQQAKIDSAKQLVVTAEESLNKFLTLKEKQGF